MNDKIVTHEDLSALRGIREAATSPDTYYPDDATAKLTPLALLDRLIAAAEADQPPLPEGWVLLRDHNGSHRALWHNDGVLFDRDDSTGCRAVVGSRVAPHDRLTPLRPTVTESQIKAAAEDCLCEPSTIRQHLAATGVEVTR